MEADQQKVGELHGQVEHGDKMLPWGEENVRKMKKELANYIMQKFISIDNI